MTTAITKTLTSTDGVTLYANATGDPTKYPIVFIHGFGCSSTIWDRQFSDSRLFDHFYMVRFDLRGHGRSAYPMDATSYESLRYAEDFKTVCDAFGLTKPTVVAWSLGASVVLDVITAYGADFIDAIVFPGGPFLTSEIHSKYMHPHIASLIPDLLSTDGDTVAKVVPKYVDSIVENSDQVLTFEEKLQWAGIFCSQPPTARIHSLSRQQPKGTWEDVIKNKAILIVQGKQDRHAQTEKMVEVLRPVLGDFELKLLDGVGHAPAFERAQEVNGYFFDFFHRVKTARS